MFELSDDSDDEPLLPLSESVATFLRYKAEPQIDIDQCPLQWWMGHGQAHKVVATIAWKFLASPATSVPCERLFSLSGHVLTKKRAALAPDNVNKLVCLSDWLHLVE